MSKSRKRKERTAESDVNRDSNPEQESVPENKEGWRWPLADRPLSVEEFAERAAVLRRGLAPRSLRSLRARPTLTALCSKHRLWKSRAANQPGHTLNQPPDCPVNQDHLKRN